MRLMVTVVGVGALGSHLVQFLRNVPNSTIKIIDCDRVEMKNTASQFHTKPQLGKLKVAALDQTMKFLFGTTMTTVSHKLVADNAHQLLAASDLVVDCLDNAASRRVVQEYVRAQHLPCVHGALAADGGFGMVVWDQDFRIDSEQGLGTATCADGEHLPFIVTVAAYLARAVQQFAKDRAQWGFSISPTSAVRI